MLQSSILINNNSSFIICMFFQDLLFCPDFTVAANKKSGPVSITNYLKSILSKYGVCSGQWCS